MRFRFPSALVIILLVPECLLAQNGRITGRVIDARTLHALPFATVYFNQTTIGTFTNPAGEFLLENIIPGDRELVVSYVGYQTHHTRVDVTDSTALNFTIRLVPSQVSLTAVEIHGKKDKKWEQQYRRFTTLFFGTSSFASLCKILNPWVLEFKEGQAAEGKLGVFEATASEALEIENLALGYSVTYLMKDFIVTPTKYNISGYTRFTNLEAADSVLAGLWERRRNEAYLGSSRHLFKALVERQTTAEGFQIYQDITNTADIVRGSNIQNNINHSIVDYQLFDKVLPGISEDQFLVRFPKRLEVHYNHRVSTPKVYTNLARPVSWIEVEGGSLRINRHGIVLNSSRLTVLGAMGEIRVAELLPFDYYPGTAKFTVASAARNKPVSALVGLIEKPYIHTDRPYYYPNEMILFKVYMNYTLPVLRDSLSRVLYVELIDPMAKVLTTKLYPIVNGCAVGDFFIDPTQVPGDYQLRAYTRWMFNFDRRYIFKKPIKILHATELGRQDTQNQTVTEGLRILTDQEEYTTRDKILLAIESTDPGNPLSGANLSISVVDATQAVRVEHEPTILTDFSIKTEYFPDSSLSRPAHAVQYGIPLQGKFISKRKNQPAGIVDVYQTNTSDVFGIRTDENGGFFREIQLMDTTLLFLQGKTLKGKPGSIILDTIGIESPTIEHIVPFALTSYTPGDASKHHISDMFSTARMLDAVTIEARKVEKENRSTSHTADFVIDGQSLRSSHLTDVLSALQRRVPGLRVIYQNTGSRIKKYIVFSGFTALLQDPPVPQEPLVLFDGVPIEPEDGSIGEALSHMTVGEIETIEILKFGSASMYGARSSNGVIVIKTRMGNDQGPNNTKVDFSKMLKVNLRGYGHVKNFVSPEYTDNVATDDRLDSRSTIYWNPWITPTGSENYSLSFYAADIPTTYRIVVEGLSAERKPMRAETVVRVKAQP